MIANLIQAFRRSLQLKLFVSLAAIVALSLIAILASQVYLVQDYFIRQAEANLRSSNYLLSRVLADPLFEHDLAQLQARLQDVQNRLPLCDLQLKDNIGTVVYKIGEVRPQVDTDFDPNSRDGCYNTIFPVVRAGQALGMVRMGIRTDDIARARAGLIRESAYFALFWFAIFLLPFFVQIRRMVQPIGTLSRAAQQYASGHRAAPVPVSVSGDDELSQLTNSVQEMDRALARTRDSQAASQTELGNEKSTLNALLATMPVAVIFADRSHIRFCNAAFRRMFALEEGQLEPVGMRNDAMLYRILHNAREADEVLGMVTSIMQTRTLTEPQFVELRDGRILRIISNTVPTADGTGYQGRIWLFADVTEEKKLLQLAEQRGEQDSLTLLYNRHRYDQDLQRIIAQAKRDGSRFALLTFDLDDFKPINDMYGHASGDVVLKQVARTLSAQLRRHEVLYRIGGDEFALLVVNATDDEVARLAERIVLSIHALTFNFNGSTATIGCSLGIARYPQDARSLQALMQLADQAMYVAKHNGKGQFGFSNGMQAATVQAAAASEFGDLKLGISIMDAQHLAMANFIHGLLDSLMQGDKSVQLHKRVDLLVELCQINFQTEEDLIRTYRVAGLTEHQAEHERQLKALREMFGHLDLGEQELSVLASKAHAWMVNHVRQHDSVLAAQLISQGAT